MHPATVKRTTCESASTETPRRTSPYGRRSPSPGPVRSPTASESESQTGCADRTTTARFDTATRTAAVLTAHRPTKAPAAPTTASATLTPRATAGCTTRGGDDTATQTRGPDSQRRAASTAAGIATSSSPRTTRCDRWRPSTAWSPRTVSPWPSTSAARYAQMRTSTTSTAIRTTTASSRLSCGRRPSLVVNGSPTSWNGRGSSSPATPARRTCSDDAAPPAC
jgi:hypothetical protein